MKTTNERAAVQGNPAETWDEERIAATGLVPELEAQGGYKGPIDGLFVLNGQPTLIRANPGAAAPGAERRGAIRLLERPNAGRAGALRRVGLRAQRKQQPQQRGYAPGPRGRKRRGPSQGTGTTRTWRAA